MIEVHSSHGDLGVLTGPQAEVEVLQQGLEEEALDIWCAVRAVLVHCNTLQGLLLHFIYTI